MQWPILAMERAEQERREHQEERKPTMWDCVPDEERESLICMIVAEGRSDEAQRLEMEVDWTEVMRRYALHRAYHFTPKSGVLS